MSAYIEAREGTVCERPPQTDLDHAELRRVFSGPRASSPGRMPEPEPEPEPETEPGILTVIHRDLVAKASTNSWKSWAGRKEGGDGFMVSDLFSGAAQSFGNYRRHMKSDERSEGKDCPVCMDDSPEPDATGKRWMRLYCGCTVCSACVRNWNVSEIESAGDTTKRLSCPVCLTEMRPWDAGQTLVRCNSAAQALDVKARDEALRGMADTETGTQEWHPCPHCKTGGGFVTADCISGRRHVARRSVETEELAERRHLAAHAREQATAAQAELETAVLEADWSKKSSSRVAETLALLCGAPLVTCVLAANGMPHWCVAITAGISGVLALGHQLCSPDRESDYAHRSRLEGVQEDCAVRGEKQQVLGAARRAEIVRQLAELLEVGCPHCVTSMHNHVATPHRTHSFSTGRDITDNVGFVPYSQEGDFQLPESSLDHADGTTSTDQWVEENARGCPVCGVAIQKNGGCDHMNCTRCVRLHKQLKWPKFTMTCLDI